MSGAYEATSESRMAVFFEMISPVLAKSIRRPVVKFQ